MSQNHYRTRDQILLMAEKIANTVGKEIFPDFSKRDQKDFFEQMLTNLYNSYTFNGNMKSWCGTTFHVIETLLSKVD